MGLKLYSGDNCRDIAVGLLKKTFPQHTYLVMALKTLKSFLTKRSSRETKFQCDITSEINSVKHFKP